MKSIGLSEEVYKQLLWTKHDMEKQEDRSVSFDKVVFKLIMIYNDKEGI